MHDPYSLPALDALAPDLVAIDSRTRVMRDGDSLPAGTVALVLRFATSDVNRNAFATEGVAPLALAVEVDRIHVLLTAVERAMSCASVPETPEVIEHQERWGGNSEYRADRPSWITAGLVEWLGTQGGDPEGVLTGVDAEPSPAGCRITLHTATGLPFTYRCRLALVEELWDLLYERWQDLDPSAGLWV